MGSRLVSRSRKPRRPLIDPIRSDDPGDEELAELARDAAALLKTAQLVPILGEQEILTRRATPREARPQCCRGRCARSGTGAILKLGDIMRRLLAVALLASNLAIVACKEPPGDVGSIRMDIDVHGFRTSVHALDLRVAKIAVYRADAGESTEDVDCTFRGAVDVIALPTPIHLDLTSPGRTLLAGVAVHAGPVSELRLLITSASLAFSDGGITAPRLHRRCEDDSDAGPGAAILRLVPLTPLVVQKDATVEVAVQFDVNRDISIDGEHREPPGDEPRNQDSGRDPGSDAPSQSATLASDYNLVVAGLVGAFLPNQLIVRFEDDAGQPAIDAMIAGFDAGIVNRWIRSNLYTLRFPVGTDLQSANATLKGSGIVRFTAPDAHLAFHGTACPTDGLCPNDYSLDLQPEFDRVGIPAAWASSQPPGGTGKPIVAVIDNGFPLDHPDLIGNLFINIGEVPDRALRSMTRRTIFRAIDLDLDHKGYVTFADLNRPENDGVCPTNPNVFHPPQFPRCVPLDLVDGKGTRDYGWQTGKDKDGNGLADDVIGWNFRDGNNLPRLSRATEALHGTQVAGLIGAEGNNGIGLTGVNWHVRLLLIQIDEDDIGTTVSQATLGFKYAATMAPDIVNASFGFVVSTEASPCSVREQQATGKVFAAFLDYYNLWYDLGLDQALVVLSAGNCIEDTLDDWTRHLLPGGVDLGPDIGTPQRIDFTRLPVDDAGITHFTFGWPQSFPIGNGLRVADLEFTSRTADPWFLASSATHGPLVEIGAPGTHITVLSMGPDGGFLETDGGAVTTIVEGSSFAAPIVAGTAALLLSSGGAPAGDPCRLADRILRTAIPFPNLRTIGGQVGIFEGRVLGARDAMADAGASALIPPVRTCP